MLGHKFETVTEMVGPSKVRNLWRSKHFENVPSKVVDVLKHTNTLFSNVFNFHVIQQRVFFLLFFNIYTESLLLQINLKNQNRAWP